LSTASSSAAGGLNSMRAKAHIAWHANLQWQQQQQQQQQQQRRRQSNDV
jgi:hypothetical protein